MAVAQNRFGIKGTVDPRNTNENVFPAGAESFNRFGIKDTRNANEQIFTVQDTSPMEVEELPMEEEQATELSWTAPVIPPKEGKQGFAPIELADQGVVADENAKFDYQGYLKAEDEKLWANYTKLYKQFREEEKDKGKVKSLNRSMQNLLSKQETNLDTWACTLNKQCGENSVDLLNNLSEEWTISDLRNNKVLIASIQKTNGAIGADGKVKTKDQLLSEWAADQQYLEYNFGAKALQASKYWRGMTDEQKDNAAIQWISFQKVKGRQEEGGLNNAESWKNIGLAIASDPTNYVGFGIVKNIFKAGTRAAGVKIGQKPVKAGLSKYLQNRAKTKGALIGAGIGFTFEGVDEASGQQILKQAGVRDSYDWSQILARSSIGAGFGATLGFGLSGGGELLTDVANRYIIRNGLSNQEFLDEIATTVTDEKSLRKWLKNIGWNKSDVQAEVKKLREAEEAGYVVPSTPKNTEADIIGKQSKTRFQVADEITYGAKEEAALRALANERIIPNAEIRNSRQIDRNEQIRKAKEDVEALNEYQRVVMVQANDVAGQQPFSRWGYNVFDKISNILGEKAGKFVTRSIYGNDALLTNSGARGLADALRGANATIDINVARFSDDINNFINKNAGELGDINKLIDKNTRPTSINKAQKDFLKLINDRKVRVLNDAYKARVITKEQLAKYKADESYIPRVWDASNLMGKEGSEAFSTFLRNALKKKEPGIKKLIDSITGNKKLSDEVINSNASPESVRNMFQLKSIEGTDMKRSTHLENERKFKIPERLERELDPFMADPADRWTKFFHDTIRRNEYAKRFGANDEKFRKFIKDLRKQKTAKANRQADDIEEIYFTQIGDASRSATIRAAMENPKVARAVAKINAIQNHKLGLAAIPNATQSFVNGTVLLGKSGNMLTAPFRAISAIARAIIRTKRDQQIFYNVGVLGEMDIARIATENAPSARIIDKQFKGLAKFLNEPTEFLRGTGFMSVERMNRRAAGMMGYGHVNSLHNKLMKLVSEGRRNSTKAVKLERELKELGVGNPFKAQLSEQDLAVSGHMFNKFVNFSGESGNLPVNWSKPWFKLMTKFKSFMFYQARFLKRNVADELFIHGNAKPLALYLVAAGLAGNTAEVTRAFASGKDIEENRDALELLIAGIGNAGGAGLWFDTMIDVKERGSGAFGNILGPTATDVFDTFQDVTTGDLNGIIKRITPNLPGKGALFENSALPKSWRDI